jgi:hypothetical protein
MDTFVVIGLWRARPAWRALTLPQRAAWRRFWAQGDLPLFAPARRSDGDLNWVEIEDGVVWVLCELMPPNACHSFVDVHEPIGMSDFLVPIRWLSLELSLAELATYWLKWIWARRHGSP